MLHAVDHHSDPRADGRAIPAPEVDLEPCVVGRRVVAQERRPVAVVHDDHVHVAVVVVVGEGGAAAYLPPLDVGSG